jgi:hypothetical protein
MTLNPFRAYFVLAGLLHASSPEDAVDRRSGDVAEIHGDDIDTVLVDQYSNDSPASDGVVAGRRRA